MSDEPAYIKAAQETRNRMMRESKLGPLQERIAELQAENKALREENQDLRLHLITALVPDGYDTKTWESWLGKISQKNS